MLLIDCYNVLHSPMPPPLAGLDTARLCVLVGRGPWSASARGGYAAAVVCDGRPSPLGLVESPSDAVELVYSGPARSADAVIIDRIERATAPRRLTVVSTDREIRTAAKRRRARSWTSDELLDRLAKLVTRHPADRPARRAPKPDVGPLPPGEVERWLEVFGIDPPPGTPRRVYPPEPDPDDDGGGLWPPW